MKRVAKLSFQQSEIIEDPAVVPMYRGDMIVALKYMTGETSPSKRTKKSKGALHVMVKEAKGLIAARPNGNIDALCKAYDDTLYISSG